MSENEKAAPRRTASPVHAGRDSKQHDLQDGAIRERERLLTLRELTLLSAGEQLAAHLSEIGVRFCFEPAPHGETDAAALVRTRSRNIALATAWWRLSIRGVHTWHRDFLKELAREYRKIVADPPRDPIHKARTRARFQRELAARRAYQNTLWHVELHEWLASVANSTESPETLLIEREEQELHDDMLDDLLATLTPKYRQALADVLNDRPTTDAADRQRRSRVRRKLRQAYEAQP